MGNNKFKPYILVYHPAVVILSHLNSRVFYSLYITCLGLSWFITKIKYPLLGLCAYRVRVQLRVVGWFVCTVHYLHKSERQAHKVWSISVCKTLPSAAHDKFMATSRERVRELITRREQRGGRGAVGSGSATSRFLILELITMHNGGARRERERRLINCSLSVLAWIINRRVLARKMHLLLRRRHSSLSLLTRPHHPFVLRRSERVRLLDQSN